MRVYKILSVSVVILLITVLFAGVAIVPAAAIPADTMQFRYNAAHTGDYSPVAGNTQPNNRLKWSYTTGDKVESSPAVYDNNVYIGSQDNNVYALNGKTGAKLWSYPISGTGGGVSSSPATGTIEKYGEVWIGGGDGIVYNLNSSLGIREWSFGTYAAVLSSPAFANDLVFVGSNDGHLWALDSLNGMLKWDVSNYGFVTSSPAVADGIVYYGNYGGYVVALYANNGTELWDHETGGLVHSSPTVVNGVVYVGSGDTNVYALNATTGAKLWSYKTGNNVDSSPAVANGVVYVGSDDHKLYALNATTGAKLWSYTTGSYIESSPAYANGVVYVGSDDHNVYAINAATGAKKWSYTTGGAVKSSPAVVNGLLYVGSEDGKVYAIGNEAVNAPTQTALAASTSTPAVNQPTTFTATLKSGITPLSSKSVTIYHYLNGVKYIDTTKKTNSTGQITLTQTFSSTGQRTYYASFAGDTSYKKSTSSVVNVNVKVPIRITLAASTTTPAVNQKVTFTAKLYWWDSATNQWTLVSGKPITIYHYLNGVKYTDTAKTTNANGQITLAQTFGSKGVRTYYATFAGDKWYKASTSAVVTIRVH